MNNKRIGTKFEQDFAEFLSNRGYWVHLVAGADNSGSQPADIIVCRYDKVWLFDCKTLNNKSGTFTLDRLEENQRSCFERFYETGNHNYWLAILFQNDVYVCCVKQIDFKEKKTINIRDCIILQRGFYENINR